MTDVTDFAANREGVPDVTGVMAPADLPAPIPVRPPRGAAVLAFVAVLVVVVALTAHFADRALDGVGTDRDRPAPVWTDAPPGAPAGLLVERDRGLAPA